MRYLLVMTLILGFAHQQSVQAQAWTRAKGAGYAQLGFSTIEAGSLYGQEISTIELRREVSDVTLQGYLEYGITDKITLNAVLPVKILETSDDLRNVELPTDTLPAGSLTGLGNISIAGIYGLKQGGKFVSSAKLRVDINSSDYDSETGLRTGYDAWGFAPSILGGVALDYFFASSELGFNLRTNDYSHQFFFNLQGGVHYKQRIFFIAGLEYLQSFENGGFDDGNALQTGLYVNDLEFTAFQLKLGGYPIENLGLWISTGGGFDGSFVARARALSIAVSYQWN